MNERQKQCREALEKLEKLNEAGQTVVTVFMNGYEAGYRAAMETEKAG